MRINTKNPFLLFLPFLILYIVIVFLFPTDGTSGDENRYLMYVNNILHGYYSPPDTVYLGNGPGYPLLLTPFVALHLPLICITLLNAFLYYLSVVFLFKTLIRFAPFILSLIASIFWACYFNLFQFLPIIYTEILTAFLVTMFMYFLVKAFMPNKIAKSVNKHLFLAGFILGYLALTKSIFGYVLVFMIIGCALLWFTKRSPANFKKAFLVLIIAVITTAPYLLYTYYLTGKVFYWGTIGGNNLYWMSSPIENEYGDWVEYPTIPKKQRIPGSQDIIIKNHEKDFEVVGKLKGVELDEAYKRMAIANIKAHPFKFLENCFSNVGRMLFNYPFSYKLEKPSTLLRLPFNGLLVVLGLFCLFPTLMNWKKLPFALRILLWFTLLYLAGSLLASAETRMFAMTVPVFLLWIIFVLQKSIRINFKWRHEIPIKKLAKVNVEGSEELN